MPELVVGRTAQAPAVGGLGRSSGHPMWIRGGNPDGSELRNIWYTFGIHLISTYPLVIGVGRLVSIKNWSFSGSMLNYQRVYQLISTYIN